MLVVVIEGAMAKSNKVLSERRREKDRCWRRRGKVVSGMEVMMLVENIS